MTMLQKRPEVFTWFGVSKTPANSRQKIQHTRHRYTFATPLQLFSWLKRFFQFQDVFFLQFGDSQHPKCKIGWNFCILDEQSANQALNKLWEHSERNHGGYTESFIKQGGVFLSEKNIPWENGDSHEPLQKMMVLEEEFPFNNFFGICGLLPRFGCFQPKIGGFYPQNGWWK